MAVSQLVRFETDKKKPADLSECGQVHCELSDNVKYNLITRINNVDLPIVDGLCSPGVLNQTVGPPRIFPCRSADTHRGEVPRPIHEVGFQILEVFSFGERRGCQEPARTF